MAPLRSHAWPGKLLQTQRLPGQARHSFGIVGGGSKSQAPDIRCLTFGTAADDAKTMAGLPWQPLGLQQFPGPGVGPQGGQKSSTGYPVLDFWSRHRGTRTRGGLAQATAGYVPEALKRKLTDSHKASKGSNENHSKPTTERQRSLTTATQRT